MTQASLFDDEQTLMPPVPAVLPQDAQKAAAVTPVSAEPTAPATDARSFDALASYVAGWR